MLLSPRWGLGEHAAVRGTPAENDGDDAGEQDGGDQSLRPDAVDTPFLEDEGFEVAEEAGAEEADLGEVEDDPEATEEGEEGDERVGGDAEDGDGDVPFGG